MTNLIDLVEEIHRDLINSGNEDYMRYLRATYDEHAVEGSLAADNLEAARIIRDKARELGVPRKTTTVKGQVDLPNKEGVMSSLPKLGTVEDRSNYLGDEKLATIVKALNGVLRRYHASRKQRRTVLHGGGND